jgi:hypothetical protein
MTAALSQAQECISKAPQAEAALGKLKNMIKIRDVTRVEIYSIPYRISNPIAIAPDIIEQPDSLHPNTPEVTEAFLNKIAPAIDETIIWTGKILPDIRWSLKMYDKRGEFIAIRIDRPYFGEERRNGMINDICVTLNTALSDWLEANFKPFKSCPELARSRSDLEKCSSR